MGVSFPLSPPVLCPASLPGMGGVGTRERGGGPQGEQPSSQLRAGLHGHKEPSSRAAASLPVSFCKKWFVTHDEMPLAGMAAKADLFRDGGRLIRDSVWGRWVGTTYRPR